MAQDDTSPATPQKDARPGFFFADLSTSDAPPPTPNSATQATQIISAEELAQVHTAPTSSPQTSALFAESDSPTDAAALTIATERRSQIRADQRAAPDSFLADIGFGFEPDEGEEEGEGEYAGASTAESADGRWGAQTLVLPNPPAAARDPKSTAPTDVLSSAEIEIAASTRQATAPDNLAPEGNETTILPAAALAGTQRRARNLSSQPVENSEEKATQQATAILPAAELAGSRMGFADARGAGGIDGLFSDGEVVPGDLHLENYLPTGIQPAENTDLLATLERRGDELSEAELSGGDDPHMPPSEMDFRSGGILPGSQDDVRTHTDREPAGYFLDDAADPVDLLADLAHGATSGTHIPPSNFSDSFADLLGGELPQPVRRIAAAETVGQIFTADDNDAESDDFLAAELQPPEDQSPENKTNFQDTWGAGNDLPAATDAGHDTEYPATDGELLFEGDDALDDLLETTPATPEAVPADSDWGDEALPPEASTLTPTATFGATLDDAAPIDMLSEPSPLGDAEDELSPLLTADFTNDLGAPEAAAPIATAGIGVDLAEGEGLVDLTGGDDADAVESLPIPPVAAVGSAMAADSLADVLGTGVVDDILTPTPGATENPSDLDLNALMGSFSEDDEASAALGEALFETPDDLEGLDLPSADHENEAIDPLPTEQPADTMAVLEASLLVKQSTHAHDDVAALFDEMGGDAPGDLAAMLNAEDGETVSPLTANTGRDLDDADVEALFTDEPGDQPQKKKSGTAPKKKTKRSAFEKNLRRAGRLALIGLALPLGLAAKHLQFRKNWRLYCDIIAAIIFIISLAFLLVIGAYSDWW